MQNYSKIEKFFHDIVLSKKFINKSLFELEKILFLKKNYIINERHVFITSLPRSGTTSILNFLYGTNEFASLTYRNMPFILAPNFSKLLNKKNLPKKTRLHGDGILFDIKSPEALDEFFFDSDEKFIKNELANYLNLILFTEKKKRYLSKNNLNFSRIDLILKILPNSLFIIPIRDPLQHSFSLLQQHLNFIQLQKKDDFVRRYMNYLGHNEFGIDHKAWNKPLNFHNPININYWLEQWCLFYHNVFKNYQSYKSCFFLIYEELTNIDYIKMIQEKVNLNEIVKLDYKFFKNSNKKKLIIDFDKNIYEKANSIYLELKNKFV